MADDAAGASWEEQKAKWGARGARGMRTCAPGRECLADGRTGRQALEEQSGNNEAPEDAFVRGLAEARAEKERRRASRGGEGSRASQRRRKRAGGGGAPAAAPTPAPAPAAAARKPAPAAAARKPAPKPRATPRPAKRRSGETAAVDTDKPKRARKSSVSAGVSSLFLTSPTTHTHAQSAAAAAPRNLGEGLWVRDTAAGTGAAAEAGATVAVLYTCRLHATNKRVDHRSNPNSPFTFILGRGAVVEGLDRGLEGMAVGGERELVVPAHLGYGTAGAPPKIPPDAALHFAIKLLRVGDGEDAAKGGKRRRARGARGGARAAKKKLAAKLRAAGEK